MAVLCPVPTTGSAFLSGMLQHIDCQAQTLGATGYQALADPGSPTSLALTALLTIFVALFGVRMLLGHAPGISEVVTGALKIGIVLMLATSWSAYRVLAYDTVLRGPAELVADIGAPSGLPGAEGGLVQRLQGVDDAMMAFIVAGAGRFETPAPAQAGTDAVPPERSPVNDDLAFGLARALYLAATIGALGFVRLTGGLLLALAPLFAGLLLFDATRSFFMGWLRMLVGVALGALAVTVILGIELSIIEPWITNVLALRAARYATPSAPLELLVIALAFAALLMGVIAMGVRMAFATLASQWLRAPVEQLRNAWRQRAGSPTLDVPRQRADAADASRAFRIAEAIAANQRRETVPGDDRTRSDGVGAATARASAMLRDGTVQPVVRIGQGYGRNIRRVSASATRRSQRA